MKGYVHELWIYAYLFFAFRLTALAVFFTENGYNIDVKAGITDLVYSPFTLVLMAHTISKPGKKKQIGPSRADSASRTLYIRACSAK